jgi:hypothetical protein
MTLAPFPLNFSAQKESEPSSAIRYFQRFEHQPSPPPVTNYPDPTNYQTFQSEELTASLSPAPLIQYSPTRRFSHVEVTGLPRHRITTKTGLKITPLPSSKFCGKQSIRIDNSDDDLYQRSSSRTTRSKVLHNQQSISRRVYSSHLRKAWAYKERSSVE